MYDNKKIVTYLMALPYVEIPCSHLNFVFEEEYIILENAYNYKKNTHCKQSGIPILWGKIATHTKKTYQAWNGLPMFSIFCQKLL